MTTFEAELICTQKAIPYTIRLSRRAKRYRISVSQVGVEIVLPAHLSVRQAGALMEKHKAWVCAQLERLEKIQARTRLPGLEPGTILFKGSPYQIEVQRAAQQKPRVRIDEHARRVEVHLPDKVRAKPLLLVEGEFRKLARAYLVNLVRSRAAQIGVQPSAITIRDQRTRWGSCSSRGTISLNWRLIMALFEVCDYVIVHELCHIREHNHSKSFWNLVESYCPDYKKSRKWLKVNANRLRPVL